MSSPLKLWLDTFMCGQYTFTIESLGYKTLQSVCQLNSEQLRSMGIVLEHCEKIMENIALLKQSYMANNLSPQLLAVNGPVGPVLNPVCSALMSVAYHSHPLNHQGKDGSMYDGNHGHQCTSQPLYKYSTPSFSPHPPPNYDPKQHTNNYRLSNGSAHVNSLSGFNYELPCQKSTETYPPSHLTRVPDDPQQVADDIFQIASSQYMVSRQRGSANKYTSDKDSPKCHQPPPHTLHSSVSYSSIASYHSIPFTNHSQAVETLNKSESFTRAGEVEHPSYHSTSNPLIPLQTLSMLPEHQVVGPKTVNGSGLSGQEREISNTKNSNSPEPIKFLPTLSSTERSESEQLYSTIECPIDVDRDSTLSNTTSHVDVSSISIAENPVSMRSSSATVSADTYDGDATNNSSDTIITDSSYWENYSTLGANTSPSVCSSSSIVTSDSCDHDSANDSADTIIADCTNTDDHQEVCIESKLKICNTEEISTERITEPTKVSYVMGPKTSTSSHHMSCAPSVIDMEMSKENIYPDHQTLNQKLEFVKASINQLYVVTNKVALSPRELLPNVIVQDKNTNNKKVTSVKNDLKASKSLSTKLDAIVNRLHTKPLHTCSIVAAPVTSVALDKPLSLLVNESNNENRLEDLHKCDVLKTNGMSTNSTSNTATNTATHATTCLNTTTNTVTHADTYPNTATHAATCLNTATYIVTHADTCLNTATTTCPNTTTETATHATTCSNTATHATTCPNSDTDSVTHVDTCHSTATDTCPNTDADSVTHVDTCHSTATDTCPNSATNNSNKSNIDADNADEEIIEMLNKCEPKSNMENNGSVRTEIKKDAGSISTVVVVENRLGDSLNNSIVLDSCSNSLDSVQIETLSHFTEGVNSSVKDVKADVESLKIGHEVKCVKRKPAKRKRSQKRNIFKGDPEFDPSASGGRNSIQVNLKGKKGIKKEAKKDRVTNMDIKPFVRIVGLRTNPTSCTVINDVRLNSEEKSKRTKSDVDRPSATASTSDVNKMSASDPWLCSICRKPANSRAMGDLFGPYYSKETKESSHSPPKKRRTFKWDGFTSLTKENTRTRTRNPRLSSTEFWLHECCAVWSYGVFVLGGKIQGVEEAVTVAQQTVCITCKCLGATLGCLVKGCPARYHYMCAVDSGSHMMEENYSLKCSTHKNKTPR